MPDTQAPFQATSTVLGLKPRTTASGTAKIRNWSEEIKKQALFSARTTRKAYLEDLQKTLGEIADRQVTPELARLHLKARLGEMGYTPQTGFKGDASKWHGAVIPPATPGSITDLSSSRRLNLIIDTNVKQAISMGQLSTSENPVFLMANPAWELTRIGARKKPRKDWKIRWQKAGAKVNWKGALREELIALKDSPIWAALGEGTGGFGDVLGSDYPPYAFGSGMGWVNCGRKKWKDLCAKEGVPDQLESIVEKARALKRAQEAAGGEGAYGASAVVPPEKESRGGAFEGRVDSAVDIGYEAPAYEPFRADESFREKVAKRVSDARAVIRAKLEEAKSAGVPIGDARKDIDAVASEWPEFDSILAPFYADVDGAENAVKKMAAEANEVEGKLVGKLNEVMAIPTPTDGQKQDVADGEAARIEDEAGEIGKQVEGFDFGGAVETAQKAAKAAREAMDERLKQECQALVDEAQNAVSALDGDDFDKIKDEFVKVKKAARGRS